MFVYELSGCRFESSCSHLNFRFCTCFEQGVPWHSGNYRVWTHSETHTWHKNIQSMHRTDKYPQHNSIIWPVWLNGWVFVYELSGCGFKSTCSHLNFRFRACFGQGVPWHSGNYRVWIHSETCKWHDKSIHHSDKYSQHSSIIWPVWLNGWVFIYKLSGCGFKSSCSYLNSRFRTCFEQGVPRHSGNYRVWFHSETCAWHDKNIQ